MILFTLGDIGYHCATFMVNEPNAANKDKYMAGIVPEPPETIEVETFDVVCDGGGGTLGHPRVYLTLVEGKIECGYCDRMYVLKPGTKTSGIH